MTKKRICLFINLFFFLIFPASGILAQNDKTEPSPEYSTQTDSLITAVLASDSSSFLTLLDSLLNMKMNISMFSARIGYISNITNAGRDFGVSQYGFSAGTSYFHNSGLYADMNFYWNSHSSPKVNPLVASLGYIGTIVPKFSISGSYEHYFYIKNDDSIQYYYPLTNSLSLSPYFDTKWISLGVDYSFLFGEKTAHRIRPNIYGNIVFRNKGFIDQVRIRPGISMLIGNQDIISQGPINVNVENFIRKVGGDRAFQILYKRFGDRLFEYIYAQEVNNVFGIMNYNFSLPVSIAVNNFTLSLSYYFNIPVALPGEDIVLDPNSYFSASLIYSLPMIKFRNNQ